MLILKMPRMVNGFIINNQRTNGPVNAHLRSNILCKINLAIFDVTYIFDHLRAILDIS